MSKEALENNFGKEIDEAMATWNGLIENSSLDRKMKDSLLSIIAPIRHMLGRGSMGSQFDKIDERMVTIKSLYTLTHGREKSDEVSALIEEIITDITRVHRKLLDGKHY